MTVLLFHLTAGAPVEVFTSKQSCRTRKEVFGKKKVVCNEGLVLYRCGRKVRLPHKQVEENGVLEVVTFQGELNAERSRDKERSKDKEQPQGARSDVVDGLNRSYLEFPFLQDPLTIEYIRKSKTLFLMRGLSGSGKSSIVECLQHLYSFAAVCSADHYFLRGGNYNFNPSLLSSAHSSCQHSAKQATEAGCPVVVVDNTNVQRWEMKVYLSLAFRCNYIVIPVVPKTPWRFDADELARRNKHGVAVEILRKKLQCFDPLMPLYYGWFLNEVDSENLLFQARKLFSEGLIALPQLGFDLLSHLGSSYQPGDPATDRETLSYYYSRNPERCNSLLHCTTKFLGRGRNLQPGAQDYHGSGMVQASVGHAFVLDIFGFSISANTLSARVRLSPTQLPLYDKPEEGAWGGRGQAHGQEGRRGSRVRGERAVEVAFDGTSDCVCYPWCGRSAHITLGCALGVEHRETNFDVLQLCDEELAATGRTDYIPMTMGGLRYYGNSTACIYLKNPLRVTALFSGHY